MSVMISLKRDLDVDGRYTEYGAGIAVSTTAWILAAVSIILSALDKPKA
jgi:hypothetical protein